MLPCYPGFSASAAQLLTQPDFNLSNPRSLLSLSPPLRIFPFFLRISLVYLSCLFFLRIFLVQLSAGQYNCGKSTFSWIGEMLASILIKCIHHTRDSPYKLHWPRITSTKIEQREPHWNREKGIGYMARTFERHCTKTRWYPSENLLTLFTSNQEIFGIWELVFPL